MAPPRKRVKEESIDNSEGDLTVFTFEPKGLTPQQCYERIQSFQSIAEFNNAIPEEDRSRLFTKALVCAPNSSLKCFECDRTYTSAPGIAWHIRKCIDVPKFYEEEVPEETVVMSPSLLTYHDYKGNVTAFRALEKKMKSKLVRIALKDSGSIQCLLCDKSFQHNYGLMYHIERCQLNKEDQPWKCYRCGFETNAAEGENHLYVCQSTISKENAEQKIKRLLQCDMNGLNDITDIGEEGKPILDEPRLRAPRGMTPKTLSQRGGTVRMKFKKSRMEKETTSKTNLREQKRYELSCKNTFEAWRKEAAKIKICSRLEDIGQKLWVTEDLNETDPLNDAFEKESVTICSSLENNSDSSKLLIGQKVSRFETSVIDGGIDEHRVTATYCGAPISAIRVAPNNLASGEEVVCVSTLSNQFDLESDSTVLQFWRHRFDESEEKSDMKLWFLLNLVEKGIVLSTKWLQLPKDDSLPESTFIGFLAVCTSLGQVLIYKICSIENEDDETVQVSNEEPHLILNQSYVEMAEEIENEVEEDLSGLSKVPPVLQISWCAESGGKLLVGINAQGAILLWDLDKNLDEPMVILDPTWQSPPSDISFVDKSHVVVAFRERILRVINIHDWSIKLEDTTMKTIGSRVHCDPRVFPNFITYDTEFLNYPFMCANNISYLSVLEDSSVVFIIPMPNVHQIAIWDIAMCPSRGILVSCGVDGRLIAGASAKIGSGEQPCSGYYSKNNLFRIHRKRIELDSKTDDSLLAVNMTDGKIPVQFERSFTSHQDVCENMWLQIEFDAEDSKDDKVQLACRDRRIESLITVDATVDYKRPIVFTGGEAGLLFAMPAALTVEEL